MKKLKILVVEDDRNLAFLLRQRLESEGYEVDSAHDAAEGYLAYLAFKPDLVLTDIAMGEEDGLDLMRHIRSHDPEVKAIYMTGDPGRYRMELDAERKRYHAGILEKPFSGRKLLESISCRRRNDHQIAA